MGTALVVINVFSFSFLTKNKEARTDFILWNVDFTLMKRPLSRKEIGRKEFCKVMGEGRKSLNV